MPATLPALCLTTTITLALFAPPPDVSSDLEPLRQRLDVPALALGVADLERIHLVGACVRRCTTDDAPIELDDRFHLGSLSKSMTALHAGSNGRWFATIWIDPAKGRAIVAAMNAMPSESVEDVFLEIERYVNSAPWAREAETP